MAHPKEVRARLRQLYISTQQPLDTIALQLNVSLSAARRWKRESELAGDDWDTVRTANALSADGVEVAAREALGLFLVHYQSTLQSVNESADMPPAVKTKLLGSLAHAYQTMTRASQHAMPGAARLGVALEIVEALSNFVESRYPDRGATLLEVLEAFGPELVRMYG